MAKRNSTNNVSRHRVTLNICDALLIANYAKEMQYYKKNEKKGRKK